MKFKFLEHTADVKFQAYGKSLEEAFENSALAMFNAMYDGKVNTKIRKKIKVEGKDMESLLYNFLEELLFLLDSENFVLSKIDKISIITDNKTNKANKHKLASKVIKDNNKDNNKEQYNHDKNYELEAEVSGDNAKNYKFNLDVKAVTYNEMFVKKQGNKFICQVVVDV